MNDTTDGKRWQPVPDDAFPEGSGGVFGVYLADNEEVEWIFSFGLNGKRTVSGYTIKTKPQ